MKLAPKVALTAGLLSVLSGNASSYCVYAAAANASNSAPPAAAAEHATTAAAGAAASTAAAPASPAQMPTLGALFPARRQLAANDSLAARLAHFQDRINLAHLEGRLSNEETDNLLSALNRVAEEQAEHRAVSGKLDALTELRLNMAIDELQKMFYLTAHDRKLATLDLPGRVQMLVLEINVAENEGRLSKADADSLRARMEAVLKQQASLSRGGKLAYADALLSSLEIDQVVTDFGKRLSERPFTVPDVDALQKEVDELWTKAGTTTQENVRLLSQQLNHQLPDLNREHKPKTMGPLASLDYAVSLQWLKDLLTLSQQGKVVAIDPRAEERRLDHDIAAALIRGHLSPQEAQELAANLQSVVDEEKAWSVGGNPLNSQQQAQVALALERIQGRLERTAHAPTKFWSGLVAFEAALDARIGQAQHVGRLTDAQAKALQDDINRIDQQATAFHSNDDSGWTSKDALAVAVQLQQANVKLHHELKDRQVHAPNLDALQMELQKTMAEGVELGKLEHNSRLVDRLAHINELKSAYTNGPGGFDERAKLAVGHAIATNLVQLKQEMHHDDLQPHLSLDMRLSALTKNVNDAAASGVLPLPRAAQYKAAIDTIYTSLTNGRKQTSGLTPEQTLAIANDIESLQGQLDDELREAAATPQQLIEQIRLLAARIGMEMAIGRLPLNESSELIAELDKSAERLAAAAATEGGLSHGEGLMLSYSLQRLADRMESALTDQPAAPQDINEHIATVDSKIANALAAGRLTIPQAQELRAHIDQVLQDKAAFSKTDGQLSYSEDVALALETDRLNRLLDRTVAASPASADISSRRTQLEKRLKDAIAAGKLKAADAQPLMDDLDRLAQTEANFRSSDEGLSLAEAMTLALDLDRINSRIDSLTKGQLSLKQKH